MATESHSAEWQSVDQAIQVLPKALAVLPLIAKHVLPNEPAARRKLFLIVGALGEAFEPAAALGATIEDLSVRTPEEARRTKEVLRPQEFGALVTEVRDARGWCRLIGATYDKHLQKPCAKLLSRDDAAEVQRVFDDLHDYDAMFVTGMERLSDVITTGANDVLAAVDKNDLEVADRRLEELRTEVRPRREELTRALRRLHALEGTFSERESTWNPLKRLAGRRKRTRAQRLDEQAEA